MAFFSDFLAALDSTSLFYALLVSHVAALLCSVTINLVKESFKGAGLWICGHVLVVVSITLTALHDPGYSAIRIISNITFLLSAQLFIHSMFKLRFNSAPPLWSWLLVAAAAVFFVWAGGFTVNQRMAVFSAIFGTQFLYLFILTVWGAAKEVRVAAWLTGIPFLSLALGNLARLPAVLTGPEFRNALDAGNANKLIYLLSIATSFLLFFGYFLLTSRQLDLDLKKKQAEILEKNRLLEKLNNDNNTIISLIAHDLVSPLTSASRLVKNHLSRDNLDSDRRQEFTHALGEYLEYSSDMVQKVLLWARSSRSTFHLNPQTISPDWFEKLQHNLQTDAGVKDISLIWNTSGLLGGSFYTDPSVLDALIHNLVRNAIKFTPRDGKVEVDVSLSLDGSLECRVADTGTGMAPDILAGILAGTGRSNHRGTEGENGSGLGLQLCRNLLERTGGALEAWSEPGKGSTFKFTIPPQKKI